MDKSLSKLLTSWRALEARERLSLSLGGGFLLALMLYFLVLAPAMAFYRDGRDHFQQTRQLDQWLASNSAALRKSAAGHVATPDASGQERSLVTVVSETASARSIRIDRIEPTDNSVRVWAEDVEFAALLTWFADLSTGSGVTVQEAVLDGAGNGRVGIRLQLARVSHE